MKLENEQAKAYCHLLNGKDLESVIFLKAASGEKFAKKWPAVYIVIVTEGIAYVSYGAQINMRVKEGDMFVLPSHTEIHVDVLSSFKTTQFRMLNKHSLCRGFPLARLFQQPTHHKRREPVPILKAHKIILDCIDSMSYLVSEGIQCLHFFDMKLNEVLYYLSLFYDEGALRTFFAPIANADTKFVITILEHFAEIKTIEDIQRLTGGSYSGIKKKFERLFDMSFTRWFAQQKSYQVYQEINCTYKSFKEIAADLDFASASHLDLFCKRMFQMSPGEIRKKNTRSYFDALKQE